jgi:hypothetical protein
MDKEPISIDLLNRNEKITEKDLPQEPEDEEEMRGGAHEQENDEDWQFGTDTPGPAIAVEDLPILNAVSQIEYNQTKER